MATVRSDSIPSLTVTPRGLSSTAEQLDALRRTQDQADLRMKIGVQLVKAAEAHATQQKSILGQVKAQQDTLRLQIKEEVAVDLRRHDHQIAQIDDTFTQRLQGLEDRIDGLSRQWEQSRRKIDRLLDRAGDLLDEPGSFSTPPALSGNTDPQAGATVAPPMAPEPALESRPSAPFNDGFDDPMCTEPALQFTEILEKLEMPKPAAEGPISA